MQLRFAQNIVLKFLLFFFLFTKDSLLAVIEHFKRVSICWLKRKFARSQPGENICEMFADFVLKIFHCCLRRFLGNKKSLNNSHTRYWYYKLPRTGMHNLSILIWQYQKTSVRKRLKEVQKYHRIDTIPPVY